ncbi:MAG: phage portal protein [Candidatus Marinimicrobia bacterium]|jgi:lambda family phage portal protein|nr:phage portal protein [Candidatus Neomarinimicrobiota bacterium]
MLKPPKVKQNLSDKNLIDKIVNVFAPVHGIRRARARMTLAFLNSYDGASKTRRALKQWATMGNDADSDILGDLETLRERSRDLGRNNPLAVGALKTKLTHVVGTGMRLQARIDRDILGYTDEAADAWEATTQREWRLFWDSKDVDLARTLTGTGLLRMAYSQEKANGDVFILLPRVKRPGVPYDLCLQIIEADRVCNKDNETDTAKLSGGIEKDQYGAPENYHILKRHPGSIAAPGEDWEIIKAFGEKTGLRNILHLYNPTRPGQSRGVPDLAPVIELFKQLGRYSDAEVMAAVISSYFTIFIESDTPVGGFDYSNIGGETNAAAADKDYKMGPGMIVEMEGGDKVHDANPGRPNANFDPFVLAIMRQIGAALEIPFEILIKHFTKSYSAARASLLEFFRYVTTERKFLTDNFLKPVYEIWMYEAVATGRISAPGFFNDPALKAAYLNADFIGTTKGQIDELKEVKAAKARIDAKLSTLEQETTELTGQDWEKNHTQQVKERKKQIKDGLIEGDEPDEE